MRWPLAILLVPGLAFAAEMRHGESDVVVGPDQVIQDDLYIGGGTVRIAGKVMGDLVITGGTLDVTGPVTGDVIAFGGTIRLGGPISGSVRAAGGEIMVTGTVEEDVVAAGGQVTIASQARVGRDVVGFGGTLVAQGPVLRNITVTGGSLALDGPVGGDVYTSVGTLEVGDRADVRGKLTYRSGEEATIAPGARIEGGVARLEPAHKGATVGMALLGWLRRFVGFAALGLLFLLVAPGLADRSAEAARTSPGLALILGLAFLVGVPFASIFVIVVGALIGGFWIGLFGLVLWMLGLALGVVVAARRIGELVLGRARRGASRIAVLLVGMLLATALPFLPWVGGALLALLSVLGAGALVIAAGKSARTPDLTSPSPVDRSAAPVPQGRTVP